MIYAGIDPGLDGAIAIIEAEGTSHGHVIATRIMPTIKAGTGNKRLLDHRSVPNWLRPGDPWNGLMPDYVVIEEQQVMRGEKGERQGAGSGFTIGRNYGALLQALADFEIPHEIVRPQAWQKMYGISSAQGDTKAQAAVVCQQLFPAADLHKGPRSGKPHDGVVDALLIAECARRKWISPG